MWYYYAKQLNWFIQNNNTQVIQLLDKSQKL